MIPLEYAGPADPLERQLEHHWRVVETLAAFVAVVVGLGLFWGCLLA
jgi:hypothetical protein